MSKRCRIVSALAALVLGTSLAGAEMATVRLKLSPAGGGGGAAPRKPDALPTAYVAETPAAPAIDGKLEDAGWA